MKLRISLLAASLTLTLTCTGGCHHQTPAEQRDAELHPHETDAEREERHHREAELAQRQAAAAERFHKALEAIAKVKPGDSYADFYHQVTEARLSLERVTDTADGRVERYAFMDNSTAFVTVVIKADHVTEIHTEGTGQ